jgi:hypothetical protein
MTEIRKSLQPYKLDKGEIVKINKDWLLETKVVLQTATTGNYGLAYFATFLVKIISNPVTE